MSRETLQRCKYVLTDYVMLNFAILIFDMARFYLLPDASVGYVSLRSFMTSGVILLEQMFIPLLLLLANAMSGYYNRTLLKSRIQEFVSTLLMAMLQTVIVYLVLLTNQVASVRATNYELLFYLFMLLWIFTYTGRYTITALAYRNFRSGRWLYNVLVIGVEESARAMTYNLDSRRKLSGITPARTVSLSPGSPDFGLDSKELETFCLQHDVKEIYFTTSSLSESEILRVIYMLIPLGLPVKISAESLSVLNSNIRLQNIYEEPYVDVTSANLSDASKNIKRCMDIVVSALMLVLLAVPMCIIGIAVKMTSSGGIIFSQERIGRRRKPFNIYKFRTMRVDAEASGPCLSSEHDPRVTPLGRKLRKYRIDELPQLWNVLKGDMSLVGPRPERRYYINLIMKQAPYYSLVHQVRPGITSWGMVKYGYATGIDEMVARLRYDLVYLANMSVTNDLKIIIYTVKTVVKGRGM